MDHHSLVLISSLLFYHCLNSNVEPFAGELMFCLRTRLVQSTLALWASLLVPILVVILRRRNCLHSDPGCRTIEGNKPGTPTVACISSRTGVLGYTHLVALNSSVTPEWPLQSQTIEPGSICQSIDTNPCRTLHYRSDLVDHWLIFPITIRDLRHTNFPHPVDIPGLVVRLLPKVYRLELNIWSQTCCYPRFVFIGFQVRPRYVIGSVHRRIMVYPIGIYPIMISNNLYMNRFTF